MAGKACPVENIVSRKGCADLEIKISSPKHYETYHGSSDLVRAYLDQIAETAGKILISDAVSKLRISLLIATPEELAQGLFLAYENFDWGCQYAAVGVNGDFLRYHEGDDQEKIIELSEMLRTAFTKVGKKRKAKFDSVAANEIVSQVTRSFLEKHFKK